MQRRAGVLVEVPQRVPLHEADAQLSQGRVGRPVMLHLQSLH
jgi:hypothetical protein